MTESKEGTATPEWDKGTLIISKEDKEVLKEEYGIDLDQFPHRRQDNGDYVIPKKWKIVNNSIKE